MQIYCSLQKELCSWRSWSEVSSFILPFRGQFLQLSLLPISRNLAGGLSLPELLHQLSCIGLQAGRLSCDGFKIFKNIFLQYRTLSIILWFSCLFLLFLSENDDKTLQKWYSVPLSQSYNLSQLKKKKVPLCQGSQANLWLSSGCNRVYWCCAWFVVEIKPVLFHFPEYLMMNAGQ